MKSVEINPSTFQLDRWCTPKDRKIQMRRTPSSHDAGAWSLKAKTRLPQLIWHHFLEAAMTATSHSGVAPSISTSAVDMAVAVQMSLDYPPLGSTIDLRPALCAYQKSWRCRKVCLPETLPPLHLSRADELVVSKKALRGDALSIRMRRGEY